MIEERLHKADFIKKDKLITILVFGCQINFDRPSAVTWCDLHNKKYNKKIEM